MRPEPGEPDRIEGAPVDRDRDARTDERHRLGRATRVEMAGSEPRSPAPHRQERDVDRAGEIAHLRKEVGVAREVDLRRADDAVAQGGARWTEWAAAAVMARDRRLARDRADAHSIAGPDLGHVVPAAGQEPPEALRDDEPGAAQVRPQGRQVEVIVVSMGNEDGVRRDRIGRTGRPTWPPA